MAPSPAPPARRRGRGSREPPNERARLSFGQHPKTPWNPRNIVLNVNGIEVIYNHVILVLKGVSLQVPEGGIVALLGGNGAGKTTTLRAVSNLLKGERGAVTKGSIELRGERIENLTPADLVQRGVVQVMEAGTASRTSRSRRTCSPVRTRAAAAAKSPPTWRRSTPTFRGSSSGADRRPPTPRAASSRCARSAAR
jgi:ATPase subunit of ABC transporter with duplicated ATPase domains